MKTISSYIYYIFVISLTIAAMAITFVIWTLTYPLGKKYNAHITCNFTRVWFFITYRVGWLWGWRIKYEGLENLPKGACIFMSNHQGYYDIPIFLKLNKTLRWVSKKEVLRMVIVGQVLFMRGDVLVDRGNGASAKHMIETCKKNLDMGVGMVIYPEGTRTKNGDIGPFKAGGFLMAKQCGYPIVPSVIVGNWGCFKDRKVAHGHKFILRILPPITAEEIERTDTKTLMAKTEEMINREYEKIRHIND